MTEVSVKTCVIYCRVSSQDQVSGTSLESQERLCREYADRAGLAVREVFVEAGESAKTADRPELNKAIAFCRRKHVGVFLVYKVDRFARNQDDHVTVRAILRQSGTELRSVTEPIDGSPMGRAMEGMLSVFAELDNNVRRERTMQGMRERVQKGVWVWPAPLGYIRLTQGGNIVPDPETAPLIRLAFEQYATGTYSFARLAEYLAARGLKSSRGRRPDAQLVHQVITNPIYSGVIDVWGERFEGTFAPLVSPALFAACQIPRKRGNRGLAPRSFNNPEFPLRGYVRCVSCLRPFTGSSPRNGQGFKYPYYHHYLRSCPEVRYIPKDKLEGQFGEYLDSIAYDAKSAAYLKEVVLETADEGAATSDRQKATLQRQIADLKAEVQRVFDLHRSGIYSDEDFLEQKRVIGERIDEKRLLLSEEAGDEVKLEPLLDFTLAALQKPTVMWEQLSSEYPKRVQFLCRVVPAGTTYENGRLRTDRLGLMYQLKQEMDGGKNHLVDHLTSSWNELISELREWKNLADTTRN